MLTANKMNEGMGGEKGKGLGERKPHDLFLRNIYFAKIHDTSINNGLLAH